MEVCMWEDEESQGKGDMNGFTITKPAKKYLHLT